MRKNSASDMHRIVCNEKVFNTLVSSDDNPISLEQLRHQMCKLPKEDLQKLAAEFSRHVDRTRLIQQVNIIEK